jgi:hypothetical protein
VHRNDFEIFIKLNNLNNYKTFVILMFGVEFSVKTEFSRGFVKTQQANYGAVHYNTLSFFRIVQIYLLRHGLSLSAGPILEHPSSV